MKRISALLVALFVCVSVSNAQFADTKPFANPAFMYGTDLGKYMQTLYRLGKFDEMVKFTSAETVKKYGRERVKDYYETCGFGYEIDLKSMSGDSKYKVLSYNARINATTTVVRMKVSIESDTSKVVLENLKITY